MTTMPTMSVDNNDTLIKTSFSPQCCKKDHHALLRLSTRCVVEGVVSNEKDAWRTFLVVYMHSGRVNCLHVMISAYISRINSQTVMLLWVSDESQPIATILLHVDHQSTTPFNMQFSTSLISAKIKTGVLNKDI